MFSSKKISLLFVLSLTVFVGLQAFAERVDRVSQHLEANPGKQFLVYKFSIKENIMPAAVRLTQKAMAEADSMNADFILLHLNTYGGAVDAADSIRTKLMQSKIPVIVFIDNNAASAGALISIACDRIYMRSGSNIGAATVVDQAGEVVPDKYQSYMRSMMRSTAEAKGRDPQIAQAMVDPEVEVEGVIEKGKVLTFTATEAIQHGFCEGIAETIPEVLKLAGIEPYTMAEQKLTAMDRVINFLINPIISGLLIMIIIGGIYFELQTPGVGFPLAAAVTAALLYFAPLYLEGLAANWEILIFLLGLILIAIEIFVIPGFGVTGILGILFMILGLTLSLVENIGFDFSGVPVMEMFIALLTVIVATTMAFVGGIFLSKQLLTTTRFGELALQSVQDTQAGFSSANLSLRSLVGSTGVAFTVLRPSGKIEIDDEVYDATALTGYIEKGDAVKVVKYEATQLFVVKV